MAMTAQLAARLANDPRLLASLTGGYLPPATAPSRSVPTTPSRGVGDTPPSSGFAGSGAPYAYAKGQPVTADLVRQVYQYQRGRNPSQYEIDYFTNEKNKKRRTNRRQQFYDFANGTPAAGPGTIQNIPGKHEPYTGTITPLDQRLAIAGVMPRGTTPTAPPQTPTAPAQSLGGPLGQPANLSSIYANAGPYMQQALGLAGQSPPAHSPVGTAPAPMHVRRPMPGQFQISPTELNSRQWVTGIPSVDLWREKSPSAKMPWLKVLKGIF